MTSGERSPTRLRAFGWPSGIWKKWRRGERSSTWLWHEGNKRRGTGEKKEVKRTLASLDLSSSWGVAGLEMIVGKREVIAQNKSSASTRKEFDGRGKDYDGAYSQKSRRIRSLRCHRRDVSRREPAGHSCEAQGRKLDPRRAKASSHHSSYNRKQNRKRPGLRGKHGGQTPEKQGDPQPVFQAKPRIF